MRLLWSLPKAAPVLLRHMAAYAELVGEDLEQAQRDFGAQVRAATLLGIGVVFLILCGILLMLALTWDTPYRVIAIVSTGGVFALLTIIAALYRFNIANRRAPFLDAVRREWQQDRMLLEHILSADKER